MAALGFDDCAACLVPLSEDTIGNPRKLSCGHSLHEPCWLELLRFGVDPTCAFCRASASDPYSGSAEEQCDYGALEYIRAVRGTVAGSPARHVVGRRCLELLQSVLTMNPRHARGRVFMGLLYQKGIGVRQDHEAAIQHFSQAMQDGNGLAAVHVGRLYKEGTGVLKDEPRARELFGLADRGGCLLGTLELAIMCKGGQGGELDAVLARELFSRAAHLGDPLGLHELAVMLRDGEGGPRDEARARELFSRASDLGYTLATLELGGMYMEGLGGEKDEAMGMELYRKVEFGQAQVKRRPVQDDPRTVAQGWVGAGAGKALYASEIKALADTGEWWQLKEPEPTKQDEAWLAMLGLAVEDRPKARPPKKSPPPPGAASGGVWRAAMSFGSIVYGDPVQVSHAEAAKASSCRTIANIEGDDVCICVEYVTADGYAEFMSRNPEGNLCCSPGDSSEAAEVQPAPTGAGAAASDRVSRSGVGSSLVGRATRTVAAVVSGITGRRLGGSRS
eukprot:TRINITY_DN21875_c0_g2_i2.p1 TRINITY_DN21875_c0_g2~~TRINITY_DN21875_c0_g2_i2.p1  ORF type:complete len:550 (+),score=78.19 TRINITY_DN21875_c0_g2_i2:136-1650(+)